MRRILFSPARFCQAENTRNRGASRFISSQSRSSLQ